MKTLSKQFAALATHLRNDEFVRARIRLTGLYVLITAIILGLFSGFLYFKVNEQLKDIQYKNSNGGAVEEKTAIEIAVNAVKGGSVTGVDWELIDGQLVYVVEVLKGSEDIDVYVDRESGDVQVMADTDSGPETFADQFVNDFEENIIWANVLTLLIVAVFGYWFAGRTLRPIANKMHQHEQFSGDVAHEIRTPLAAMLSRTESVLRKNETVDVYKESLEDFRTETKRLITLTEDLLLTAQSGAEPTMGAVSLSEVVTEVTDQLSPLVDEKELTLTVTKKSNDNVYGNRTLLERLFQNILHNAIKFTKKGGNISVIVAEKQVIITDTGIGMNEVTRQKVFDRFYTGDTARDERGLHGSGLGLSIVKQIAVLHHAKVILKSEVGKGTEVRISFLQ